LNTQLKPPSFQAAFTLLELIIVIVVLTILSSYIFTQPDSSERYRRDTASEQLLIAASLAQQLSMNDSSRSFSLEIQPNQIDIQVDGSSLNVGSFNYPITLDSQVSLSPTVSLVFDQLGRTSATTITVQTDTAQLVCIEASGFVHRC
jgi:prepilin-type N-terminal cleavage/methylation domain-containing protein